MVLNKSWTGARIAQALIRPNLHDGLDETHELKQYRVVIDKLRSSLKAVQLRNSMELNDRSTYLLNWGSRLTALMCNRIWVVATLDGTQWYIPTHVNGHQAVFRNEAPDTVRLCRRCGGEHEDTLLHRYYQCPNNDSIECEAVQKTRYLVPKCMEEHKIYPCKWFTAILPCSLVSQVPLWVEESEARPRTPHDFCRVLRSTLHIATDGSGGTTSDPKYRRVGAAAGMIRPDASAALAVMQAPRRQTVLRAELYALIVVLQGMANHSTEPPEAPTSSTRRSEESDGTQLGCHNDFSNHTIYIDASYVVNGIAATKAGKNKLQAGTNGDLWCRDFSNCIPRQDDPKLPK